MPEYRELFATFLMLYFFLDLLRLSGLLDVLAFWADATDANSLSTDACEEAQEGYVHRINSTCFYARGRHGHQTPLWPPMWKSDALASPVDIESATSKVRSLTWKGVIQTPRAVALDLGPLHLMVCPSSHTGCMLVLIKSQLSPLTHTSVQLYTREAWERSILPVKKDPKVC